jgi:hypothetical protein
VPDCVSLGPVTHGGGGDGFSTAIEPGEIQVRAQVTLTAAVK